MPKLQLTEMQWNANMTKQNHLGHARLTKPDQFTDMFDQIFSAQNIYSGNPLSSLLFNKGNTKYINGTSWEWLKRGANSRPMVIVKDSSNGSRGKRKSEFYLYSDKNFWVPGDVMSPGNKKIQVRIMTEAVSQGNGKQWRYTVRLMDDLATSSVPARYLKIGTPWVKLYSQYEEAAYQSGSTILSTPFALRSSISKFRKQYKITDYASTEVLAVKIPDSNGKLHDSWIRYAEVEFWQQWYQELERGLWYSRAVNSVDGANGLQVRSGAGIHQQLEDSNIHYYNQLTAKLIEDYLLSIFYSKTKPGSRKLIKGFTGEYGMIQFNRAMVEWMNNSGFVKNIEYVSNKTSSPYTSHGIEVGFQVVRYHMANGISLELIHNPIYDDRRINFEIDPLTGYPIESQRITFLDFSGDKGSNLKVVKKKDSEAFAYIEGLYGPYGPKWKGNAAHSGSYYEMHLESSLNAHIDDVEKCGELILNA